MIFRAEDAHGAILGNVGMSRVQNSQIEVAISKHPFLRGKMQNSAQLLHAGGELAARWTLYPVRSVGHDERRSHAGHEGEGPDGRRSGWYEECG